MDNAKTLTDGNKVLLDTMEKTLYISSGSSTIAVTDVPGLINYLHSEILKNKPKDIYNRPFEAKSLLKEWAENVWKMKQYSSVSDADDGIFVKFDNMGAANSACKFFEDRGWKTLSDGHRAQIYQDSIR